MNWEGEQGLTEDRKLKSEIIFVATLTQPENVTFHAKQGTI